MSCCLKRRCAAILILSLVLLLPSVAVSALPQEVGETEVSQSRWMDLIDDVVEWVQNMWGGVDPGPGLDPFLVAGAETPEEPDN